MNYDLLIKKLGEVYPSKRNEDGINWSDLGIDINLSHAGISKSIRERVLSLDVFEKLCVLIKASPTDFFKEKTSNKNETIVANESELAYQNSATATILSQQKEILSILKTHFK